MLNNDECVGTPTVYKYWGLHTLNSICDICFICTVCLCLQHCGTPCGDCTICKNVPSHLPRLGVLWDELGRDFIALDKQTLHEIFVPSFFIF